MPSHDVLIVGAGPVGLALALALKGTGLDVVLADARPRAAVVADPRVLALSHGSRLTLEWLGAWEALPATPIRTIHVSQHGGFGRTRLQAEDHDVPALGYVVSAGDLAHALRSAVERSGARLLDETEVLAVNRSDGDVVASLSGTKGDDRTVAARLVACAEGGLQAGGRDIIEHDYRQHALISQIGAPAGHGHVAFERFTPDGPLALLPHGKDYALVHVVSPRRADELLALDAAAYAALVQERIGQRVRLGAVGERLRYPLALRYRRDPVGTRTVWLGNAAQTLHPVAGQGFNLALRDVWALGDALLRHPGDPGSDATLAAYRAARRLDRFGAIRFTDALVRVFSNDFAPLRQARGAGLFALDVFPPLRHFLARRMMFGARAWP